MGYRQLKISDISGQELADSDAVTVVVKTAGKVFDCHIEELTALKTVNNVVELEIKYPAGDTRTVLVPRVEFSKLISDDKLATFDSSRGRRSGYSPTRNGSPVP